MDNFIESRQIKIAFGIPFDSLDFHELLVAVGELVESRRKKFIFAVSAPWLLEYGRNPLNRLDDTDIFLATDSTLTGMARKHGQNIKMPMEYFEFPEQIATICAHYGHSLLHVSATSLKTDILVADGYIPLSLDLFTNFKISGELDEKQKDSIVSAAANLNPDIILISASPNDLRTFVPEIYKNMPNCLLICTPSDEVKCKLKDKISNILSPLLLMRQETLFLQHIKESYSISVPSSISYDDKKEHAVIQVSGALSSAIIPELGRMGKKMLQQDMDIELDLSKTTAISIKGLEAIFYLNRICSHYNKKVSIQHISPEVLTLMHQSGIASFFKDLPGIAEDEPIQEEEN
ncbi:MAG: hypothetical protein BA863_08360 [Desulfovibrio sp. S3730MH75]|nr:MAG: hypothetical protein BA863_08360 [Desulfovibrio sp. S3730MH75]